MDDGKGWLFVFILLVSFLVGLSGYMIFHEWWAAGIGVLLGLVSSVQVSYHYYMPVFHSYAYVTPATEAVKVTERVTLIINVPGLPEKLIHGISLEELRLIGECVTHNDLYIFSVQQFKDYFRNSGTDGYSLYNKSVRWMKDAGALVPNSQGGINVTEHIGKYVFGAMRDGNWEVVEEYDSPPYPAS